MSGSAPSTPPSAPRALLETAEHDDRLRDFCLQLFHLAPVGHLVHDPRGLVLEANYTAGCMLGTPAHDLHGERLTAFASREDAPRLTAHFAHAVLTGERCNLALRLQRPGGTRFHAVVESISLDPPGPDARVLTTLLDDTERVRTEARLLEHEATLTSVLGAVQDAIVGVDEDGAIRAFEGAAERVFGHRREDVLGKHVGMLFDVAAPPAVRGPSDPPPRAKGRRRDGTSFDAVVSVQRVAGASYGVLCVRDMSQTEQLSRALGEAQRLEIAGRLAAGVAHDTSNLLMRVLSAADALLEDDEPEVMRARAAELRRAAEGGAAIVRQLASLLGADVLGGPSEVELDRAIEGLRAVLAPMLGPSVALLMRLEAPAVRVRCHRGQVEQLVLNLALNARDAMADGGTLEIATSCAARGGRELVEIVVRDTGVGMSEAVRARIFEPSFTTKPSGTGLGLATVASIVRQARGRVEVESAVGAGTTFRIELPAVRPARAAAAPRAGGPPPSTLLLVARDTLVRSTLRAHLEGSGHRVIEASDSIDALERCREHGAPIHAMLLEAAPGASVVELAERARSLHPEAALLFLSGSPRAELVGSVRLESDVFLLQTPCSAQELSEAIARVLSHRERRRRVLLVEDDALIRRSLGERLRRRGYEVALAETIAEAMARHREGAADVIVSDDRLPDGRAADLLRALRGEGAQQPVVVLSGLGPEEDHAIASALRSPRTAFVQKPADIEQLLAAFDALLPAGS